VTAAAGAGDSKPVRPAYEQARDELIELVKRLEAGGLTLEQSLQLWERGEELAAICEEWLEGARARLATALARQEKDADPDAPF
jgi:exodeoxyribonuclease VII small subunit